MRRLGGLPGVSLTVGTFSVALFCVGACRPVSEPASAPNQESATPAPAPVKVLYPAAPGSFVDLVANAAPSVLHLKAKQPVSGGTASMLPGSPSGTGLGTGFAVQVGRRNFIVTNEHVTVNDAQIQLVLGDGATMGTRVVGRDRRLDVALLEIEAEARLAPLRLGSSNALSVGEWVAVLGNPFGPEVTATVGIVSSLGGPISETASSGIGVRGLIQIDAAIHPGNSGGPVLNMAGEVVAIATALESRNGPIGFAIPIDRAKHALPMLAQDGYVTRPWLGLKVLPVEDSPADISGLGDRRGALVSEVVAGPAIRAGLQRGDVILSFDGVDTDHRNLPGLVATSNFEAKPLIVLRDGKEMSLTITPEPMAQ